MSEPLAVRQADIGAALTDMWRSVLLFVPKALAFVAILLVGYFVAKFVRKIVDKVLERVGFDRAVERGGLGRALERSRYDASDILARVAYYAVLLFTLQLAFGVWGPNPISDLIAAIVSWLPLAFVAIIIVVVAAAIASAVRDLITGALGGLSYGRLLANVAFAFIVGLGVIAALNQVGIATTVTEPVLIAVLATIAGVLIVGVGGGLVRPMQRRWERWLDRMAAESAVIRDRAKAYAATREEEQRLRAEAAREEQRLREAAPTEPVRTDAAPSAPAYPPAPDYPPMRPARAAQERAAERASAELAAGERADDERTEVVRAAADRDGADPTAEQATAEQATAEQATAEQATAEQATVEEAPVERAPVERAPTDDSERTQVIPRPDALSDPVAGTMPPPAAERAQRPRTQAPPPENAPSAPPPSFGPPTREMPAVDSPDGGRPAEPADDETQVIRPRDYRGGR
jgi:mechanosensitive ion channel-like protein